MPESPEEYGSVRKAIEILLAFTSSSREMGTLELSEKLHLHKSTVSRLLRILKHYKLVQQDRRTKKYTFGKSALDFGMAAKMYLDSQLIVVAQSLLNELRNLLGEHVALEVISGNATTVVCHAASTLPVRVSTDIGQRLPIHAVAGGKSILAFLPPDEVDELVRNNLTRFTVNTITDPKVLKRQLGQIRRKGISYDKGEYYPDVRAIAAPVFNADERPVAAVVMPVPAYRMGRHLKSNTPAMIRDIASKISSKLLFLGNKQNGH